MRALAHELLDNGYEPTERSSPFAEDGRLWTNSYELVCDKTGAVIRKDEVRRTSSINGDDGWPEHNRHTYSTDIIKLAGGYTGSYDWGRSDDRFTY